MKKEQQPVVEEIKENKAKEIPQMNDKLNEELWNMEVPEFSFPKETTIKVGEIQIFIKQGNIVTENVDAITNAANGDLWLGGGVAGAIRSAGGPTIQKECNEWVKKYKPVPTGGSAFTKAGKMENIKYVIHSVGPMYSFNEKDLCERQL